MKTLMIWQKEKDITTMMKILHIKIVNNNLKLGNSNKIQIVLRRLLPLLHIQLMNYQPPSHLIVNKNFS